LASDPGAPYDDVVVYDGATIEPMVTWGINPGHAIPVSGRVPKPAEVSDAEREGVELALRHMQFTAGQPIAGTKIDVAFIGSCTNSRLSDLRAAAEIVKGQKKSAHVKAIVVPGSEAVARDAIAEGLDEVFRAAGFEWREPGCSMCLAMNPDKLEGDQISASSSNRNFIGRQGSPSGRTLLMSPQGVAAAAIAGEVTDVRQFLTNKGAA
jgi:3-isopropylmalate/(R)-2-methylmalate dehydratase large subunit